ncbi:hypothetical protein Taro_012638 [Colocasia esculenta]|uniref:Protein N-terminal asparagine amidohydrolase n=1 Tax=Colocasia esculenta TaxID=4460 RepID=A0A843UJP3_COLES|nr:hypothetical protein [Colocasia esculenta]
MLSLSQKLAGTDEATTCVGIVIRNQDSGMTSIAHLDSPKVVDSGLTQMLSSLAHGEEDALMVHLIGGFEDASSKESDDTSDKDDDDELGYSLPLCSKIIETLKNRREHFHIETLCVLWHNTKRDSFGNAFPVIGGFVVIMIVSCFGGHTFGDADERRKPRLYKT